MASPRCAAIIAIGDELVLGEKLDTNSRSIARTLVERGWSISHQLTLADDLPAIAGAIRDATVGASLIITTGGLGPTLDDLGRAALALVLNEKLVTDDASVLRLERWSSARGIEINDGQRSQALRPPSAVSLPNDRGTAPGLLASLGPTLILCLPGPPSEMRPMLESALNDFDDAATNEGIHSRFLHAHGLGEGIIGERLTDLMARAANPVVGTTASGGIVTCRVRFHGARERAKHELDRVCSEIRARLDPWIFGEGDQTLAQACVTLLRERSEHLVVVESCTGGLLGGSITSVGGSSEVFEGGWITYSNEMKRTQVGVLESTLAEHGAVSDSTAREMAKCALSRCPRAHRALSVTGIAGPGGAVPGRPVGTVFIGCASHREVNVRRFNLPGDRDQVRNRSVVSALSMLRFSLLELDAPPLLWEQPAE